jgi:lipopolysaccharide biosynthesis regulator YciM
MQTSLSFEFWLTVFIICIAVIAGYYLFYFFKKREEKKVDNTYLLGLKYMVEGENRRAVEMFKEAVRHNSENIDAYIKLGVILRNEKLYTNAIRIHKDLLLRAKLSSDEINEIKFNLALDYIQSGYKEKALNYLESIKSDKKYGQKLINQLLKIYEEKNDWDKAIETLKSQPLVKTEEGKQKLAYFKVKKGEGLDNAGQGKEARILYKDAIKINLKCSIAYLYIGDSYLKENRASDAINTWTNFCEKVPEHAHLVFDRLEKAWYEKGQFSKIEELYLSLIEKDENNIHVITRLAAIYRKKGDYKQSLRILNDAQKKDVLKDVINFEIVKVLHENGQYMESSKQAIELVENKINLPEK